MLHRLFAYVEKLQQEAQLTRGWSSLGIPEKKDPSFESSEKSSTVKLPKKGMVFLEPPPPRGAVKAGSSLPYLQPV